MTLLALARSVTNRRAAGSRWNSLLFRFHIHTKILMILSAPAGRLCLFRVFSGLPKISVHSCEFVVPQKGKTERMPPKNEIEIRQPIASREIRPRRAWRFSADGRPCCRSCGWPPPCGETSPNRRLRQASTEYVCAAPSTSPDPHRWSQQADSRCTRLNILMP